MRISDWSADVCSSDLLECLRAGVRLDSGIRQHVVDQSVFAGLGRGERFTEQDQFGGAWVTHDHRHHQARCELGADAEVDERQLATGLLARIAQVPMQIGRGSCRESVDQSGSIREVSVKLKKKIFNSKL